MLVSGRTSEYFDHVQTSLFKIVSIFALEFRDCSKYSQVLPNTSIIHLNKHFAKRFLWVGIEPGSHHKCDMLPPSGPYEKLCRTQ
ncbi:hypothetical protein Y032_0908g2985 [Ancylostoma ceylanicum]|uniref:Uncharacterized protein n=1 Tax=Ancylostoma ceylanicum TaxID=53326 RepID=A0A016WBD9_9BILA|nr:hypothetical protein Y032_0908g2985 [Ancylostoma ceylanicum]